MFRIGLIEGKIKIR